jgi:inosine/xanthosine triphosphate pyrophosphatase family protein
MAKTNYRKEFPKLFKNVNGEQFEMDAEEYEATIAQWEANEVEALAKEAEAKAKATAKAAILDRIGLTADELKTILG